MLLHRSNAKFGGTCLRVGCIPSKALLESSHIYHDTKTGLSNHGVIANNVQLDLAAMMKRKDQVVQTLTSRIDLLFKKNKVTGYNGIGQLRDPNTIAVQTANDSFLIKAKHIVLATGSRPASMRGVEEDGNLIGNSTTALAYPAVPKRFVVIGGGYIGLELGSVWNRLGSEVIVLEAMDRSTGMDNELSQLAQRIFARQGIEFRLNSWVESARVENGQCVVRSRKVPNRSSAIAFYWPRVKCRTPKASDWNRSIETDKRGFVPVDTTTYQTTVKGIYALGDLIGGAMLAHKAMEEAVVCMERIAGIHAALQLRLHPSHRLYAPRNCDRRKNRRATQAIRYRVSKGRGGLWCERPYGRCSEISRDE